MILNNGDIIVTDFTSDTGTGDYVTFEASNVINSSFQNIIILEDGTNIELYVDGVNQSLSIIGSGSSSSNYDDSNIGVQNKNGYLKSYYQGYINQFSIWNKILNSNEISNLNECNALSCSSTPTIQADVQDFYSSTNITLNLTTNPIQNTNMTYLLDNMSAIPTSICNNCNTSTLELTNLSEGAHSILFVSENSDGQTNSSYNFTIDITPPEINVFNTSERNSYTVNWTNVFNYSDTNLDSCEVRVENTTSDCNTTYTFEENGNQSIEIYVNDSAGNENIESYTQLVNPYQYFNFQTPTGSTIYNFTFNGEFFEEQAKLKIFDLVDESELPKNVSLLFEKESYESTNITVEFNSTSDYNETNTINLAKIVVNIYDRETGDHITDREVTLTLIDSVGDSATTSTGKYNFTKENFPVSEYHIIAKAEGYETEVSYFDFNNQEVVSVNIYMLNSTSPDAGSITLVAKDEFSQFIQGATCQAKEWVSSESAHVVRTEGKTNINGEVILPIEIGTKEYVFTCEITDDGVTYSDSTEPEIVKVDLDSRTLILRKTTAETFEDLEGLSFSINETVVGNLSTITVDYTDTNNQISQVCITYYDVSSSNWVKKGEECSTSSSAIISDSFLINNTFKLKAVVTATTNTGITYTLEEFNYPSIIDLETFLENYGLQYFLPTVLILIGLGLGLVAKNIYIGVSLMSIMGWISFMIVPGTISGGIATIVTVFAVIMFWGGYRIR
jgi:hypothetical protein